MNALWRRRLHRCARASGWVAGVALILLAVVAALAQLLLPLLARHPDWVAAQLSARLQRPVSFASMEGRWTGSGPVFVMHGVSVGAAAGESGAVLQLPESELKLDFGGWLLPSRHLLNLHVRGLQLDLLRDAGGWHVNGIGVAGDSARQPLSPGRLSADLWLEDLRVVVTDATLGKHYTLLSKQLRLSHQGNRIRFGGVLRRDGVSAALRTAGRFRDDGSAGQVWVEVGGAELKPLLDGIDLGGYTIDHGRGQLNAWLDWRNGQLSRSLIRFDLDTLAVTAPAGGKASVASLHGLAGVRHADDGYDLRWAGDDGSALALNLRQGSGNASVDVAARQLQLAPLLPWLALKPALSPALSQWLGSGHPRGVLDRLVLHWSRAQGLRSVELAFSGLGIDPVGKLPGVSSLHGELRGDAEALSLELPAQATTLAFPHTFRQPFVLSRLAGTLAFWPQDGDWHIGVDALDFNGAGYAGQARGELMLPAQGGAPFMEMYAKLTQADVVAAKLFWPIDSMSPGTVAWLDRALVAGRLDHADVLLRGDLRDWPFRHNEGRFEARAVIGDLTLDYGKGWPRAEGVSAVANFIDNGMLVEADGGHALGVKADRAVALIPDFHDALLDLNVQGSGNGASLMEFVRKSPIASREADTLAKLKLGGSGTFGFHLALPLKEGLGEPRLDGLAELKDADLSAPAWKLQLDKLNGPLSFDLHGMRAGPLDAGFRGQPSTLQLAIAGANSDPATVLSAQLHGNYRLAELVQDYPTLDWIGKLGDGRGAFDIGFTIARVPGRDALAQTLSVDSPLDGIALELPAPLHKPAAASLPLHLTMSLPIEGSELRLGLGDAMRGYLRLADAQRPLAGTLAFGSRVPAELPSRDLRIRGHAGRLDVTGWVQHVAAGSGSDGPGLESLEVSADQTEWFGRELGALKLHATPQADLLSVDVDGPAMLGNYSIPRQELDKRGITARLKRLYWPKDPGAEAASHPPKPDAGAALPAAATPAAPAPDPANTGINPAALPPFHVWIGDLRMGDAKLGEARLETWPTAEGLHIEQLRALSSRVQITGSGDWNGNASNSHTHMKINFAAEDLGAMLGALGFDGLVNGGKTRDQLDASWPGAPSGLALATMDGTLSIRVDDGRIPEATSPGVGRLLGLVSLTELPRRLTLDFGDVFGKGLAFDSISGDFKLANGNAITDNLSIVGPAANISVNGRTGLRARDYDQQMVVVPHVGNSLPLVGAMVGGPVGAAAGFAVQGILGRGLNQAASARYRITGSWDEPVITLVEKRGSMPPPAAPLLNPAGSRPAAGGGATQLPALGLPAAAGSAVLPAAPSSVPPPASRL
ncbi:MULTISPECIES: YhdP family protein [Rhodanobacter]|uniref:YhdP family protein n=1 Tax=Rhodanobacter TaxID=75309 RepID=UPI0004180481|nr:MULTISPECIES: YhdP family protein [Rhodanobacter]UJJ52066.1 TIGR02099 family protein [Rhodanobacter denitrificans]UJM94811.1 TIGR02099 family protein [Rhodanobacter denitrificans]UJM98341.1 TIGR02099 family protein [Rhodanobacter denitrificans]UJN22246.1 TIGR02099 family protein [Rhodanobacter denitrificans]